MNVAIDIVSDLVCPWCFIGKRRLAQAMALVRAQQPAVRFQLNWLPYFLNPDTPPEGEPYRAFLEAKFGGAVAAAKVQLEVTEVGRESGVVFHLDRIATRPNTLRAHRLIYRAQSIGHRPEEIEALVLGTRWVAQRSDARLGLAARNALAKIGAVLPPEVRDELDAIPLLIGPSAVCVVDRVDLSQIRQAIRAEQKVDITYRDDKGADSVRTIWPFALGFFDSVRIVMAWCELRQDYRHFRTDRIAALSAGPRYPRRRHALLKEWRALNQAREQPEAEGSRRPKTAAKN